MRTKSGQPVSVPPSHTEAESSSANPGGGDAGGALGGTVLLVTRLLALAPDFNMWQLLLGRGRLIHPPDKPLEQLSPYLPQPLRQLRAEKYVPFKSQTSQEVQTGQKRCTWAVPSHLNQPLREVEKQEGGGSVTEYLLYTDTGTEEDREITANNHEKRGPTGKWINRLWYVHTMQCDCK